MSHKTIQLVANPEAGLQEIPVPPELQDQPCLSPEQIKVLAAYGVKLEEHYHCPEDVWNGPWIKMAASWCSRAGPSSFRPPPARSFKISRR